jgi:YesN/AraC family two-component response regulator
VVDFLNDSFQQDLTIRDVAIEFGLHPAYLSMVFRRFHKPGIGDHLHGVRIEFARTELLKARTNLAYVAAGTGFVD